MRKLSGLVTVLLSAAYLSILDTTPALAKPLCASETVSEAAAVAMAKTCNKRVEITEQRDEYKQIFANADGTQTLEAYAVPQRVRKNGEWKRIDPKLQRGKDGRLYPAAVKADISFSGGGTGPLASMVLEGKRFNVSWPGALAAPVVEGNTATYPAVLPGVDLTVTATTEGFSHVLVVKTAEAAANPALAKVRYQISGDLSVRNGSDGSLELVDAEGKVLPFGSHASMMWDSALDPRLAGEVAESVTPDLSKVAKSTASEPSDLAHVRTIVVNAVGDSVEVIPNAELLRTGTLPLFIDPPWDKNYNNWVYANNPGTNWTAGEHARVGRNPDDGRMFRSFFNFPINGLAGKQVRTAGMNITVDHTAACAGNTAYAYRTPVQTGGSASRVTWSPALSAAIGSAWADSNEAGGCGSDQGDDPVTFSGAGFLSDVQGQANASASWYTVGLCMCTNSSGAGESGTYQWMKFFWSTAVFWSTYNTAPGTPSGLTTSGVGCGGIVGTTSPVLDAIFNDADGSDSLSSTFYWKELPSGTVNTVTGPTRPAGNHGSVTLSLGAAAEGKSYSWQVSTSDGIYPTPATSGWCNFTVNASPPPVPGVSSTQYPEGSTANGGPGEAGQFVFSNGGGTNGQDVTTYMYGWTDPPALSLTVSPGASVTIWLTPPRHGYNVLHVYSKDSAGTPGPTKHYSFLVGSPDAATHHWPLDDIAGHGLSDQIRTSHLSGPNVTWTPDARYVGSQGLTFNNNGDLSTGAVLQTQYNFSVSAWVKMTDSTNAYNAIVSQEGVTTSGFILYATQDKSSWAFVLHDGDNTSTSGTFVYAPAQKDVWTHLVGVYDKVENRVKLYVNGVLKADNPRAASPWAADGNFHVGWAKFGAGSTMTTGIGQIADVRVWNRSVVPDDLWGTNADAGAGTQATAGLLTPTEVGTWDYADGDALDGSYWSRHMNFLGSTGFTYPGHNGNGAYEGYGSSARTETSLPVLHANQSYTLSAWVYLTDKTDDRMAVGAPNGTSALPFFLGYDKESDRFDFTIVSDQVSPVWQPIYATAAPTLNTWVHLTATYDASKAETSFYVNGVSQGSRAVTVNWAGAVPILVGGRSDGNDCWFGQLDQVKVFNGAMTSREVQNLFTNTQ